MEPLSLATELRKLLLYMAHLSMLLQNIRSKIHLFGLLGLVVVLKTIENRRDFGRKWAWLLKFQTD